MSNTYVLCSYYGNKDKLYSYIWGAENPPKVGDLMYHLVGGRIVADVVEVQQVVDSIDNLPYRDNLKTLTIYAVEQVGKDNLDKESFLRSLSLLSSPRSHNQSNLSFLLVNTRRKMILSGVSESALGWLQAHHFKQKPVTEWIKYGVERKENYISK